jgi:hypothetical protein
MSARQFHNLRASSLYCVACAQSMPVREKLLLILPEKELYEYQCTTCGAVVGSREVSAAEQVMRREAARDPRGRQVRIL